MKIFEMLIGFFSLCCFIVIGYTVYRTFHVEGNCNFGKDSLVLTHIYVKDTIVIRMEKVKLIKTDRQFRTKSLHCSCMANDSCDRSTDSLLVE